MNLQLRQLVQMVFEHGAKLCGEPFESSFRDNVATLFRDEGTLQDCVLYCEKRTLKILEILSEVSWDTSTQGMLSARTRNPQ